MTPKETSLLGTTVELSIQPFSCLRRKQKAFAAEAHEVKKAVSAAVAVPIPSQSSIWPAVIQVQVIDAVNVPALATMSTLVAVLAYKTWLLIGS